VTWTASAAGGQAPYTYRFIVWDGVAWTDARAWDASNVFTWTPPVANPDYKVAVLVRSVWNTGPNEISISKPFAIRPSVTSVALSSALASPQALGTPVDFIATASGGQAPYEYLFAVHDGVTWTIKQGWSAAAAFRWTPTVAFANYRVLAKARSAWNKGAAERETVVNYAVMPAVVVLRTATVVFQPATSGGTVDYYRLEVFAAGADPDSATPIATQNLGLPVALSGESSVDVRATILPLAQGPYLVTVVAVGPGGTARSVPVPFIR
jgi:hypothetical protein